MKYYLFLVEFVFGLHKTIYINLRFFGLSGLSFPIIVSKNTIFRELSGKIIIESKKFGGVKIGFTNVFPFDGVSRRCVFRNTGVITFKGVGFIGQGCSIDCTGILEFGNQFRITANSVVICKEKIQFGDGVLISWDVQICDSDFHKLYFLPEETFGSTAPISIGSKVWVCAKANIMKGVTVSDNCVIAACSLVLSGEYCGSSLIGGHPAKIIKDIKGWDY